MPQEQERHPRQQQQQVQQAVEAITADMCESGRAALDARVGAVSHIGAGSPPLKEENQDVVRVERAYGARGDALLLLVLDGHGPHGLLIANVAASWLVENARALCELPREDDEGWQRGLERLFADAEAAIAAHPDVAFRCRMSGTTCSLAIVREGVLRVANVGDSRIVLVRRGGACERLTADHRPDVASERARVEKAGGVVYADPVSKHPLAPLRVFLAPERQKALGFPTPTPGLMLTRSLGDQVAKSAGCSCVPHVGKFRLAASHLGLVGASDGLWDVVDDARVASLLEAGLGGSPAAAAQQLVQLALDEWAKRGQADNICVLCAVF